MPKTTNLGLELTDDNSTTFKDWREKINGVGSGENKSNMQIIDEFAGSVNTTLSNYYNKTETENIINDAILGLLGGES